MQSWKAFIWGFPKMVVPPFHTPKWWSFLVGKPPWLLGKPTILGNSHCWRNHNFLSACICGCVFNIWFQPENLPENRLIDFERRTQKATTALSGPKRDPTTPDTRDVVWSRRPKGNLATTIFRVMFLTMFFRAVLLLVFAVLRGAALTPSAQTKKQQPYWMMPHLRRPGIEMSKKELNLLVEHQRQELEKLRKAACNLIWRIRCSLDCSHQQPGGCLVWLS